LNIWFFFTEVGDLPNNFSSKEEVNWLLTKIQESQESGKWQAFITALESARKHITILYVLYKSHKESVHFPQMIFVRFFKKISALLVSKY